jgi:hypothetical protein
VGRIGQQLKGLFKGLMSRWTAGGGGDKVLRRKEKVKRV